MRKQPRDAFGRYLPVKDHLLVHKFMEGRIDETNYRLARKRASDRFYGSEKNYRLLYEALLK